MSFPRKNSSDLECDPLAEAVVKDFVKAYDDDDYQVGLYRLYNDRDRSYKNGECKDTEDWARQLYATFREDPLNERCIMLNQDRKKALALLYSLVDEGKKHGFSDEEYEKAILKVFKKRRLMRILGICLVMDKCQALYKMELPGTGTVGMHWFCNLHVDPASSILSNEELQAWTSILSTYTGTGTMNKRLYFLLNSKVLNLQEEHELMAKWFKPEQAVFFVK